MDHFEKKEKSSFKSGTTIVGIKGKDFVLLASDKQGTLGNLAVDYNAQKLHLLNNHLALGLAGSLGDAQQIIRLLKGEIKLYELERNKKMSTKAAASFLSNLLNANRYYPYFAGFILIGFSDKPEMYNIDVIGGFGKHDDFTTIGSGSPIAIGVLERGYRKNITKKEAIELAIDSIRASRSRDVYSGGNIDLIIFTKDKVEQLNKKI